MRKTKKVALLCGVLLGITFITQAIAEKKSQPNSLNGTMHCIEKQAPHLDPHVLKLALIAYQHAESMGLDKKRLLTIVNYADPSTMRRLWVINLNTDKVLFNTLVAHGKNSGGNYATHFSNSRTSDASSLGVFLTGNTYEGEHGYSLRLRGLEPGFNNNAFRRAVVMHSAWYVSERFAKQHGRLGRSWGCFAMSKKSEPKVVHTIKDGTLLFAYYPDNNWLKHSAFL